MDDGDGMKKLFVLSRKAGNGDREALRKEILRVYEEHGRLSEIEVVLTEDEFHGRQAAKEFVAMPSEEEKVVICAGGDGSLGEIASVLCHTDTALALIPSGTGNDFARNFDYSKFRIEDTFDPKIERIDAIRVNDRIGINVLSFGFDATVLINIYKILKRHPWVGKHAFSLGVLRSLFQLEAHRMKIEVRSTDGGVKTASGEYTLVAICNGGYYGSGFHPAPNAEIDDGKLELLTVEKLTLFRLLRLIGKYKKGTHLGKPGIELSSVRSGTITADREIYANIDGELFQSRSFEFEVMEGVLLWAYLAKKKA